MRAGRYPVSFLGILRRLKRISLEYDALETTQMAMPEGSEEYFAIHASLVTLTEEQIALQDLALVMQAMTLSDAAVQLGILSEALAEVSVPHLDSLVQSGDLARDLAKFEQVLVDITRVVTEAAGLRRDQDVQAEAEPSTDSTARLAAKSMDQNTSQVLQLCHCYHTLNHQRSEIDQRLMSLLPDDFAARNVLYPELELTLARLGHVMDRLARIPATSMKELLAKATVLAKSLRNGDPDDAVLAASLAQDLAGYSDCSTATP